jgi:hypothetical protein
LAAGDSLAISAVADGDTVTLAGFTGATFTGTITGTTGKFNISAGAGTQSITTAAGADTITGGTGADVMAGGTGADTFVFAAGTADTVAAAGSVAGIDQITDLVLNGAIADLIDLTVAVANVGTTVTGSVSAATFVANMNTLLAVGAGAGFNSTTLGTITAAIVDVNAGDLTGKKYLAVDLDNSDTFTTADFVVEITGVTNTSFTTACFI